MEDFIGYVLIAMLVCIPALVIWAGIKLIRKNKKSADDLKARYDTPEERKLMREAELARDRAKRLNLAKPTPAKMKESKSYTSTPSTSSTSNDSLLTDLATLYVLNSALQHGSASAKVDYDTGTIKTDNSSSSSWGLDDSDARKSAESSFSSSDSSSSWDSGSSSSDSGPSSDW